MSGMLTRAQALRAFSTEALKVVNDAARQQFTVSMSGAEAIIGYVKCGNTITFCNTEVPKEFQGKGVGKILAKHAFDHAAKHKLNVICKCSFLAAFYKKNCQEYKNLNVCIQLDEDEHK